MASKSHRDITIAIAFAEVFCRQAKEYYQANRPRAKRIIPLLENAIKEADRQLAYFRRDLTFKDVFVYVAKKVDVFNATTSNYMSRKEATAFIIGLLAERINELSMNGSRSGKIERLESVLKPMEELYEYFDSVDMSDIEEESFGLFTAWEAA